MTGRFSKYGELKRRSILRKARVNNGRLKEDSNELCDADFNMRSMFYEESKKRKNHTGIAQR